MAASVKSARHRPSKPASASVLRALTWASRAVRIASGSTENLFLVAAIDLSVQMRGATVPRGNRVLAVSEALWILDEAWQRDAGAALRQFAHERGIGSTPFHRAAEVDLRQILAIHVQRGELVMVREVVERKVLAGPPVEPAVAPPPLPAPRAAPAPVAEELAPVDVSAQLRVLWEAARTGVPFCEECAKALQRAA